MEKRIREGLLFKFAAIFIVFIVVTLVMSVANVYFNETAAYKRQCEENVRHVLRHISGLIAEDGDNFKAYQEFFLQNHKRMNIPLQFHDYHAAKDEYEELFAFSYPGKVLGKDIRFSELSDDVKMAFAVYMHEYWLTLFESLKKEFDLHYVYYVVPTEEPLHMYYVLDGIRERKEVGGKAFIELGIDVYEPEEAHRTMWAAWNDGRTPAGYDIYDNAHGKTYAYYMPLFVEGEQMGVLGGEISVASVEMGILINSLKEMAGIGLILGFCVFMLLWVINKKYISKLSQLQMNVRTYAEEKDAAIAEEIGKYATDGDEISTLSRQISMMILELEKHMKKLVAANRELGEAREHADAMDELAHRDSLTGVGNKAFYDKEMRRIAWQITDGNKKFGIVMIDLNFLKRINDTYGHEYGDGAIKTLCEIVCGIFEPSSVFRIGGDEFVVLLEERDYDRAEQLVAKLEEKLAEIALSETLKPWEQVSAAVGVAYYDPAIDGSAENVFRRADRTMYLRKNEMKAVRSD